ncbi:LbtU family siderophore porin [Photobacterium sp. TY1-4]|uniref:LbtU family siderophore porin n=1 Tax=Photobacterium sp. TY1-4 TaxID=2899122 RepID=UPI0021C1E0BC|nr:LbtU family siderophore porin [Photobacterium sp. TY1-4]UXI04166.1 LbtU family siderophore porin [Photobacterium sp. TY1-4]
MKVSITATLVAACMFTSLYANAAELSPTELERRINDLEQQLESQEHDGYGSAQENSWAQQISIGGTLELEASFHHPYIGDASTDLVLATAELGIAADINDWVNGEIIFLYEEDDTPLEVDVATLYLSPPDAPWYLIAGQFYLPFGVYDTQMISGTLTSDVGETRETAFLAGIAQNNYYASVFLFNGSNKKEGKEHLNNWGVQLGLNMETADITFNSELSYINDIGDSDNLQDVLSSQNVNDYTDGWNWFGKAESGAWTLIGEYTATLSGFESNVLTFNFDGAKPSAWNLELGYHFYLNQFETTASFGYQGTQESLPLELPEQRLLAALSVNVLDNTAISLEWARDQDYEIAEGGTGESADTVTLQLAAEF